MIDFGVAFDKLASMETADDIANYFRAEGIQGIRVRHDACPIANWMSMQTGRRISAADVIVDLHDCQLRESATPAMREFMEKFDTDQYPDLVRRNYD